MKYNRRVVAAMGVVRQIVDWVHSCSVWRVKCVRNSEFFLGRTRFFVEVFVPPPYRWYCRLIITRLSGPCLGRPLFFSSPRGSFLLRESPSLTFNINWICRPLQLAWRTVGFGTGVGRGINQFSVSRIGVPNDECRSYRLDVRVLRKPDA